MSVAFYLLLAAALPLAGFLLLIFFGKRFAGLAGPFATTLVLASLALSVVALMAWVARPEFIQAHDVEALTYRWIPLPAHVAPPNALPLPGALPGPPPVSLALHEAPQAFSVGYFIDSLTLPLFVLVTLIAALVHLFSIACMAGDPRLPRFFAYLGLLTFAMLALLLSNSLLQLFFFWQILGIAATLLVGFWFDKRPPAMAAFRTAIIQRFGDAAFLVGMGILVCHVGAGGLTFYDANGVSLLSDSLRNTLHVQSSEFLYYTGADAGAFLGLHWLTWAGLLLFAGAAAKAAQFPLHVWLADSVEAPGPVAAMIQSATMVAAGVYLVARIYPILTLDARLGAAIIGCVTLVVGALLALVQTDLRKLLAYSTISQAGLIVLFLGAGGYTAGLLHLFTHGFFQAGLLLAAAWIVRSLGGQADLRQMGGLWRKLPLTAIAFCVAALALIGAPFFAGAYSSQFGLAGVSLYARALCGQSHLHTPMLLFYIPAGAAFLTAFYMGRCAWLIFGGKSRNEELAEEAHESFLAVLPLGILAALSVNFYEFFGLRKLIVKSLLPVAAGGPPVTPGYEHLDGAMQLLATQAGGWAFWACLGAIPAVLLYWNGFGVAERIRRLPVVNLTYLWLRERMFFAVLYEGLLVGGMLAAARVVAEVDRFVVRGMVRLAGLFVRALSRGVAMVDEGVVGGLWGCVSGAVGAGGRGVMALQSGRARVYILMMVGVLAALAAVLLVAGWG